MSKEQVQNEELNKSIDALIDDIFAEKEVVAKAKSSIDIAGDASETADEAVAKAPKGQKDEARGAGRPKQISDVPQVDADGRRASEYDDAIADDQKEDEPDEAKKQAKAVDQVSKEGHMSSSSKAPKMAPFKKSDGEEISAEEYEEFQAFKKAQEDAKSEELKKAHLKEQQDLIKSAIKEAVSGLQAENEQLKKSFNEQNELLKAMASKPQRPKSITGITQLEKSFDPETAPERDSFSPEEMKDAVYELCMKGEIPSEAMSEYEMTKSIYDPATRGKVENFLKKSNK